MKKHITIITFLASASMHMLAMDQAPQNIQALARTSAELQNLRDTQTYLQSSSAQSLHAAVTQTQQVAAGMPHADHKRSYDQITPAGAGPADGVAMIDQAFGPNKKRLFVCGIDGCPYTTTEKSNLTRHQRRHTGEKFVCSIDGCTKSYVSKRGLTNHQRYHTGEKFVCGIDGCIYATTDSYNLHRHQHRHVHAGEKFVCHINGCTASYASKNGLTYHQCHHHSGERPSSFVAPATVRPIAPTQHQPAPAQPQPQPEPERAAALLQSQQKATQPAPFIFPIRPLAQHTRRVMLTYPDGPHGSPVLMIEPAPKEYWITVSSMLALRQQKNNVITNGGIS